MPSTQQRVLEALNRPLPESEKVLGKLISDTLKWTFGESAGIGNLLVELSGELDKHTKAFPIAKGLAVQLIGINMEMARLMAAAPMYDLGPELPGNGLWSFTKAYFRFLAAFLEDMQSPRHVLTMYTSIEPILLILKEILDRFQVLASLAKSALESNPLDWENSTCATTNNKEMIDEVANMDMSMFYGSFFGSHYTPRVRLLFDFHTSANTAFGHAFHHSDHQLVRDAFGAMTIGVHMIDKKRRGVELYQMLKNANVELAKYYWNKLDDLHLQTSKFIGPGNSVNQLVQVLMKPLSCNGVKIVGPKGVDCILVRIISDSSLQGCPVGEALPSRGILKSGSDIVFLDADYLKQYSKSAQRRNSASNVSRKTDELGKVTGDECENGSAQNLGHQILSSEVNNHVSNTTQSISKIAESDTSPITKDINDCASCHNTIAYSENRARDIRKGSTDKNDDACAAENAMNVKIDSGLENEAGMSTNGNADKSSEDNCNKNAITQPHSFGQQTTNSRVHAESVQANIQVSAKTEDTHFQGVDCTNRITTDDGKKEQHDLIDNISQQADKITQRAVHVSKLGEKHSELNAAKKEETNMKMDSDSPTNEETTTQRPDRYNGIVVHFHGGGFIAHSSNAHQMYLRHWAKNLNVVIISVDYTLAPEGRYPRAFEECFYVYCWAKVNTSLFGCTSDAPVFVSGDSAGGNIALSIALKAHYLGIPPPAGIHLNYPATNLRMAVSPARLLSAFDGLLNIHILLLCLAQYAEDGADMHDTENANPLASPWHAEDEDLAKLGPISMTVCEYDPLLDDGLDIIRRMQKLEGNGTRVQPTYFNILHDCPHGFLNLIGCGDPAIELAGKVCEDNLRILMEL